MRGVWLTVRGEGRTAGRFLWGRALTRGAVRKILHRRCAEGGIVAGGRRISPHVLRHSLATHLLAAGVDVRTVQLMMRHRSIATTEKYLHADVGRLAGVLVRRSPLEGRRRPRAAAVRPAMGLILGELPELAPSGRRGAVGGGFGAAESVGGETPAEGSGSPAGDGVDPWRASGACSLRPVRS